MIARLVKCIVAGTIAQLAIAVFGALLPATWGDDRRFPIHGEGWFQETWARTCLCQPLRKPIRFTSDRRGDAAVAQCRLTSVDVGDTAFAFSAGLLRGVRVSAAGSTRGSLSYLSVGWPFPSLYGYQVDCPCGQPQRFRSGLLTVATPPGKGAPEIMFLLNLNAYMIPFRPLWAGVALNSMSLAALLLGLLQGSASARAAWRRRRGRCTRCGYALLRAGRCPECGTGEA